VQHLELQGQGPGNVFARNERTTGNRTLAFGIAEFRGRNGGVAPIRVRGNRAAARFADGNPAGQVTRAPQPIGAIIISEKVGAQVMSTERD
jgi:hypothetical protein